VRDRQLRGGLRDDLEQRPRALELEREKPCALAGAERMGRPDAERGESRELLRIRLVLCRMKELQYAERRPTQWERRRDGALLREPRGARTKRSRLTESVLCNLAGCAELRAGLEAP
jgi:hypothetical protein